jgi:hypothetical protein
MTEGTNGQPITYKLDMSGAVVLQIKRLIEEAKLKGWVAQPFGR